MTATLGHGFYAGVPAEVLPYTRDAWQLLMDPSEFNPFGHNQVIGRVPADGNGDAWEYEFVKRGAEGGVAYARYCYERSWRKASWISLWTGPNEPALTTVEEARLYTAFFVAFAAEAHRMGRQVGCLSASATRPDEHTYAYYMPAIAAADAVFLHEYPRTSFRDPGARPWWIFKYRLLHDAMAEHGIEKPFDLTEIGIASEIGGWRTDGRGISDDDMVDQVRTYCLEVARDAYVRSVITFCVTGHGWNNFFFTPNQWPHLAETNGLMQQVQVTVPLPPPAKPEPGKCSEQEIRPCLLAPVNGRVSQEFGQQAVDYSRYGLYAHNGRDYAVVVGTQVKAAHAGQALVYTDAGYGLAVEIWYPRVSRDALWKTIYAHGSQQLVKDGAMVVPTQPVLLSGNSGNSTGPHLHFGFKPLHGKAGKPVNPGYRDWVDPRFFLEG